MIRIPTAARPALRRDGVTRERRCKTLSVRARRRSSRARRWRRQAGARIFAGQGACDRGFHGQTGGAGLDWEGVGDDDETIGRAGTAPDRPCSARAADLSPVILGAVQPGSGTGGANEHERGHGYERRSARPPRPIPQPRTLPRRPPRRADGKPHAAELLPEPRASSSLTKWHTSVLRDIVAPSRRSSRSCKKCRVSRS
jgi:hypothetical protein